MATETTIKLTYPETDIAQLAIDMPGKSANILSKSVLDELAIRLDEVAAHGKLAGLVLISGKPGTFIAGADLREFATSLDIGPEQTEAMCRRGQTLFQRLSKLPFVTVVAIDGICVGGGAELSVWCDRRILSNGERTEVGFPEVKLGLYPGWGGTARLPRIIGLANAVEMISSGQSVDAAEAVRMGLASDLVPPSDLLPAAIRLIRDEQQSGDYLKDRERWSGPIAISETELGFLGATASAMIQAETKGQYPAPLAALEVMLGAAGVDIDTACKMEASGMAQLFGSPINASLLNVFFLTDRNKKDRGIDSTEIEPQAINSAAVVGAGIMGAGIAAANLRRGIPVALTDANHDALGRAVSSILEEVSFDKKKRGADIKKMARQAPLLNATTADAEIGACDVVIEAVVENLELKRQIYRRLEPQLREHAILASNTSTIPITKLAEGLARPAQFCGIHFFNPVRKMQLVEVIRGKLTSDQTVSTAVAYAKRLGKFPIVVNDGPGFLVNRLLLPYMNESLELLSEGVEIRAIERVAKEFGMPMGPITLYDMVGLDTAFYAGRTMWEAYPDRIHASPILPALVKAGRLGQKSGAGFFSYQNKKNRAEPDSRLNDIIKAYIEPSGKTLDAKTIENRLFLPVLLEATRILEEGIVRDARDVDLGLIFGVGFPPFKGGLLFWADRVGAAKLVERLKPLAELGARMQPTKLLLEMAETGRKFYDNKN